MSDPRRKIQEELLRYALKSLQDCEELVLSENLIIEYCKKEDIDIGYKKHIDGNRLLFNFCSLLLSKIKELEDEVKYLKTHIEGDIPPLEIKLDGK